MTLKLIREHLKTKSHRNHAISICLIAFLFTTIFTSGNIVVANAENHALTNYWNKSGEADIIVLSTSEDSIPQEVLNNAESVTPAYIAGALCTTEASDNEAVVVVAESDITELSKKMNLGLSGLDSNSIIANTKVLDSLNCKIGDKIFVNDTQYVITHVTDTANFLSPKDAIIIMDPVDPDVGNDDIAVYFLNYQHDQKQVSAAVEQLEDAVSYINLHEGITAIYNEFANLNSVLNIFFIAIITICIILTGSSASLNLRSETVYWTNLRLMGLSRNRLKRIIRIESALLAVIGSVLGILGGYFAALLICMATDTNFDNKVIDWLLLMFGALLGLVIVLLPIQAFLFRNTQREALSPFRTVKTKSARNGLFAVLVSVVAVIMMIVLLTSSLWLGSITSASTQYVIQLIMAFLTMILVTVGCVEWISAVARKIRTKPTQLFAYTSKVHAKRIKGITISLVIIVAVLGTLVEFSTTFKNWAYELANQQLTFDARATLNNDEMGGQQLDALMDREGIDARGSYYLGIAKLSGASTYLISEMPDSNQLNDIYNHDKEFGNLMSDEIAVSKTLCKSLNLQVNNQVKLIMNGIVKDVTIVSTFETQDYSSSIVIASSSLFEPEEYKRVCLNFELRNNATVSDLRRELKTSSITIESSSELTIKWQDSIVNGVDILIWVCVIIAVSLLIMLNNNIKNSIMNRKREFALLRTMGLSKNEVLRLLFAELLLLQLPAIIIGELFTPFLSYFFINLNATITGYDVTYNVNILTYIIIMAVVAVILTFSPIRTFNKAKNESPIDSLIQQ